MSSPAPDTRPIPSGRYAAPDPAPNTPTECPRCGAPAISRRGVALHDLDHRARDDDARRQKALLDRLERLLDSIETNVDAHGERLTLGAWIEQTDHALDELESSLADAATALGDDGWVRRALAEARPVETTLEAPAFEVLPWPGDPGEPSETDDRDADEIIPSSATHSFPGDPIPDLDPIEPDDDPPAGDLSAVPAPFAHGGADDRATQREIDRITPAIDRTEDDDDWGLR